MSKNPAFQDLSREELLAMQDLVAATYVKETVVRYIVALITATRENEYLLRGASPRATLAVTSMAKAIARLRGRDFVVPKDVQEVFLRTVAHRLLLTPRAETAGITAEKVLEQILSGVPAPNAV